MKTPYLTKIVAALILTMALIASGHANAQIINVQFSSGPNYTGTGADTFDTGTTWNQFGSNTGSDQPLVSQSGGTESAQLTFAADGANYNGTDTAQSIPSVDTNTASLLNGFLYQGFVTTPGPITFEISNLGNNVPFTLYVYGQPGNQPADSPNPGLISLAAANGGDSGTVTGNGGSTNSFTPSVNYIVLTGVTSATGTGTISVTDAATTGITVVNGFQLDLTNTPEPSTWALMLAGLGTLALVSRLRRTV
jgi:hypothetical protein